MTSAGASGATMVWGRPASLRYFLQAGPTSSLLAWVRLISPSSTGFFSSSALDATFPHRSASTVRADRAGPN